jgi:hypothetical protein
MLKEMMRGRIPYIVCCASDDKNCFASTEKCSDCKDQVFTVEKRILEMVRIVVFK